MSNLDATINVGLDGSQIADGVKPIVRSLENLGKTAKQAGQDASKGISSIGDGGASSAAKVEASTKNMIGSIQRTTAAMEAGKKTGAEYYESLAKQRGIDVNVLRPYLQQLEAVTAKQEAAARSAEFTSKAFLAVGSAVGVGVVGFVRMIDGAIEAADNMRDLSKTTGITVEHLAGLQLAAKQSGGDLDGIAKSINKLSINIGKDGDKFKALGISAKDPIEAFKQLSDIFSAIEDPQKRAALGAAALSKTWESAAPLLAEGSKSIGEMIEKGTRLSGITGDMTDQADKFKDSMAELSATANGLKMGLAGEMLPALNDITGAVTLAYTESGKLAAVWTALGGLGTFLFTDDFASQATKIRALKEELADLESNRINAQSSIPLLPYLMFGAADAWDADIAAKKKQINDLVELSKPKAKTEQAKEDPVQAAKTAAFIKAQKEETQGLESALKSAEKARESFIKSIEKEAATVGLTTTKSKIYEASLLGIEGKQLDLVKSKLASIDATKLQIAAEKQASDEHKKYIETLSNGIDTLADQVRAQKEYNERIGLTVEELARLEVAKINDQAASKESIATTMDLMDWSGKLGDAYREQALALRELAALKSTGAAKQSDVDSAKKGFDDLNNESKKFTDGLYQGLSDALMRGFESGKGFFQNFWESIKNLFKTTVLKLTVQGVMGGVTGATSGAGNLSQIGSMASAGNSIYGTIAGGVGSIGSGIGYVGGAFGSTTLSAFGSGMSGTAAGTFAGQGMTVAGSSTGMGALVGDSAAASGVSTAAMATTAATIAAGVIAGVYGGRAISSGYQVGDHGNAVVNAGTAIGATAGAILGGPLGAALGSAIGGSIGGLVNRTFGMRDKVYSPEKIAGNLGTNNITSTTDWTQKGGYFRSNKSGSISSSVDSTLLTSLNAGYEAYKLTVADFAKTLGLNADSIQSRTDKISFLVGKDSAETQKNIVAAFAVIGETIVTDLLGPFANLKKEGETSVDAVARLSGAISSANVWLGRLKQNLFNVSVSGADAASKLADAFGGLDKMAAASQSFYDIYYTDAEKFTKISSEMTASLAAFNLAMPESKEQFKLLAGSLDLNTESGRKAYAALLAIAPVFSETSAKLAELSKATASALVSAFTGNGALIPALDSASLNTGLFTKSISGAGIAAGDVSGKFSGVTNNLGLVGDSVGGISTKFSDATKNLSFVGVEAGSVSGKLIDATGSLSIVGAAAGNAAEQFAGATKGMTTTGGAFADLSIQVGGATVKLSDASTTAAGVAATMVGAGNSLGGISQQFLNASSGMLSFGDDAGSLAPLFTEAQLSAALLTGQITDLKLSADKAKIDIAGLGVAMAGLDTQTFVNTLSLVFESLGGRIKGVIDSIGNERIALREAAIQIINPTVMSKDAIQRGISGINTALPSNAGVINTLAPLADADRKVMEAQGRLDAANAANAAFDDAKSSDLTLRNFYKTQYSDFVNLQKVYGVYANAQAGAISYNRDAYAYNDTTNRVNGYGQITYTSGSDITGFKAHDDALVASLSHANENLINSEIALAAARAASVADLTPYKESLAAAKSVQGLAADAARQALIAYAGDLQNFAIDASKSVGKLSKLREETVKYYEAQKQLADLMTNSAANLRGTVANYKYDQLSPEQQFAELQAKYASSYSMALSTSGTDLAGYGDKLNGMLNPLLEKAKEIYGAGTAYDSFVATTLARADNIAGRLETLTPTNYAADSLSMLGQIDATLVALDAASKSAEKIIADAIKAGSDQTSAGLHAIVAALTGQAVPAFAAGGDFGGGLRLVGENGPELEATGASRIFNAEQTRSMLSGGSSTAKLEALVARQTQELANMRAELRAIATTNNKMLKLADRAEKDGMLIRNEEPITTVAA